MSEGRAGRIGLVARVFVVVGVAGTLLAIYHVGSRMLGGATGRSAAEGPAHVLVDGEPIAKAEFLAALEAEHGESFLPRFMERWLVERAARAAGVTIDEAEASRRADAEVAKVLRDRFGGDRAALMAHLAQYGLSLGGFRAARIRDARHELLASALLQRGGDEARVRSLFEERFGPGGVRMQVEHLLISTQIADSRLFTRKEYEAEREAVETEARSRAAAARAALLAGEDVEAVARRHSDDLRATGGASLGSGWAGRFGAAFDDAVARLDVGGVSEVIESPRGYHVVVVTGQRRGARYEGQHMFFAARRGESVLGGDEADEAAFAEAEARARAAHARVSAGESFGVVAAAVSDDVKTRGRAGELGPFAPGRLGEPVDPVLETMPVGSISEPVRVGEGFQIVRLTAREWLPAHNRKTVAHVLASTEYLDVKRRRIGARIEADARERAEALLGLATAPGADFGALVREHSEDDLTRLAGGRLPSYRPGLLGAEVNAALESMKPGEVRLVRSARGFHLIRLVSAARADFEAVRGSLVEELGRRAVTPEEIRAYGARLREAAKVERVGEVGTPE